MPRSVLIPALLVTLLATGCSATAPEEPRADDGQETATSAPTTGTTSEPTQEPETDPVDPAGFLMVEAGGLRFGVPEGWTVIDPAKLAVGVAGDPAVDGIAEDLGVSVADLAQMFSALDLYVASDEGVDDGFLDNLNVVTAPGPFPSTERFEGDYASIGATITTEPLTVGTFDAVRVTGDMALGEQGHAIDSVAIDQGDTYVTVTVSANDVATATKIGDGVIATLTVAP